VIRFSGVITKKSLGIFQNKTGSALAKKSTSKNKKLWLIQKKRQHGG
jgi:hypothetical protein